MSGLGHGPNKQEGGRGSRILMSDTSFSEVACSPFSRLNGNGPLHAGFGRYRRFFQSLCCIRSSCQCFFERRYCGGQRIYHRLITQDRSATHQDAFQCCFTSDKKVSRFKLLLSCESHSRLQESRPIQWSARSAYRGYKSHSTHLEDTAYVLVHDLRQFLCNSLKTTVHIGTVICIAYCGIQLSQILFVFVYNVAHPF